MPGGATIALTKRRASLTVRFWHGHGFGQQVPKTCFAAKAQSNPPVKRTTPGVLLLRIPALLCRRPLPLTSTLDVSMQIRSGRPEDSANLSALAIQVWLQTYATAGICSKISRFVLSEFSVKNFEALLARAAARVFVAIVGENLVGYSVVSIGSQCPENESVLFELATLYVQEPFTRKTVGSRLLGQSESFARQEGSALWLTVNSKNTRAIAFYAKHGYFKVGSTFFELQDEKHENLVLVRQDA